MNLARIKSFGLFISALCKVQTVCFEKLACSFDSNAKADSSLRRIQRFISEYSLSYTNFWVEIPGNGHKVKASWLFINLRVNECAFYHKIVRVNGELCYLSASRIVNRENKPELQIIVSFKKPNEAQSLYKERWQIESAFKALKTSSFNIEDTHLADIERVSKLFALVIIAFAWMYKAGIYLDTLKLIKIKKYGRRAKSLFKYGLTYIANLLFSNDMDKFNQCCKFLSCA